MRHYTNDPTKRAEHIANHLEKQREKILAETHPELYPFDFPAYWVQTYKQVLGEMLISPAEPDIK